MESDPVRLVVQQTKCSREEAIRTLELCGQNTVEAIITLESDPVRVLAGRGNPHARAVWTEYG